MEWELRLDPRRGCFQWVPVESKWMNNSGIVFFRNDQLWFCTVTLGKKCNEVFTADGGQQGEE